MNLQKPMASGKQTLKREPMKVDPDRPYASPEDKIWKPYPLDRVIILGMGPSSLDFIQHQYHFMYKSVPGKEEIWVVNSGASAFQHDVIFNMHELTAERQKFADFYAVHEKPLVTLRHIPEIPSSLGYPIDEVLKFYGESYIRNGISYMLAAAGMCRPKQIDVFGCDYSHQNAYEEGRCNVEYWLGKLSMMEPKIKISIAQHSSLMECRTRMEAAPAAHFYGYNQQPVLGYNQETGEQEIMGWTRKPVDFAQVEKSIENRTVKSKRPTATEKVVVEAKTVSKTATDVA